MPPPDATFDADVVTATRPRANLDEFRYRFATSDSDGSGLRAPHVESPTDPSLTPLRARAISLVVGSSDRGRIDLRSPYAHRAAGCACDQNFDSDRMRHCDELDVERPALNRKPPSVTIFTGISARRFARALCFKKCPVNGDSVIGKLQGAATARAARRNDPHGHASARARTKFLRSIDKIAGHRGKSGRRRQMASAANDTPRSTASQVR